MKLKKLLAFGLALVMCLAMAACGTNPDEKTDAEPVSITVTENWDFSVGFYPVITPMVSSTYGAGFWSRNFYNTLVSYDDNGKIQGELAKTWEISDDGKTYTFHLRDGVKFSDGTPLTSEAVKMTLEAVVTHLGPQNGAFGILRIRIAQCVQGHTAGETHHALQYISRFDQCHILLEKNDCVVHRVKLQRVSLIEFAQDQGGVLNNNPAAIGVIDKLHMVSSFNLSF